MALVRARDHLQPGPSDATCASPMLRSRYQLNHPPMRECDYNSVLEKEQLQHLQDILSLLILKGNSTFIMFSKKFTRQCF